jgi:hypothetical protein
MSESNTSEPEGQPASAPRVDIGKVTGDVHIYGVRSRTAYVPGPVSTTKSVGAMRVEIHGSWSVADLVKLLERLEDAYKAAAALESLAVQPIAPNAKIESSQPFMAGVASASPSVDDLLQTVTAFQLAGGLRLGSMHYGSPGFLELIGALNPLKTVKDGITENREINRKRDETHRLDEREREQQTMQHAEVMAGESRATEQQRHSALFKTPLLGASRTQRNISATSRHAACVN